MAGAPEAAVGASVSEEPGFPSLGLDRVVSVLRGTQLADSARGHAVGG